MACLSLSVRSAADPWAITFKGGESMSPTAKHKAMSQWAIILNRDIGISSNINGFLNASLTARAFRHARHA